MSKKKIDPSAIQEMANELKGASLFFRTDHQEQASQAPKMALEAPQPTEPVSQPMEVEEPVKEGRSEKSLTPRYRDTTTPRYHDTTVSQYPDPNEPKMIETVRKSVKVLGLKAATHRFTDEEKQEIAGLIFAYGSRGITTSANEITRIAINYIFEDYKQNGKNSVLHKVLAALNS